MQRVRLLIEGHVQGVGFRYHTCARAEALGLTGWVRNLRDGRVEAELEGADTDVEDMVAWCRRGPAGARVSGLTEASREPITERVHDRFHLRA